MEPTRIGRFIAERRKALGLTQRQLAERLAVSDKAVSKWETGRGLPDVLLMPPLCAALGITVNDLLSGERVGEGDYRKKAEENMMELMRENAENRQRLLQSIACGGVTVVAVCALVALAAFCHCPLSRAWRCFSLPWLRRWWASGRRPRSTRAPGGSSARTVRSCSRPPWRTT